MLLKGSDVGWSMILSYFMLKKSCYSVTEMVAAALIMLGIGAVLVLDMIDSSIHSQSSEVSNTGISVSTAAILCLGGALLNSLCSVVTEAVLKQILQEEQDRLCLQTQHSSAPPSKLLLSNAYSMYTSFFSFVLLLPLALFSRKDQNKENQYLSIDSNSTTICPDMMNEDDADPSVMVRLAIGLCLTLLAISRFLERLCKHFICVYDSAVTFSMVQAARRWLGIFIVGFIFHEDFANGMIFGSLISGVGFALHGHDASRITGNKQHDYKKLASNLSDTDDTDASASEEIELSGEHLSTNKINGK